MHYFGIRDELKKISEEVRIILLLAWGTQLCLEVRCHFKMAFSLENKEERQLGI